MATKNRWGTAVFLLGVFLTVIITLINRSYPLVFLPSREVFITGGLLSLIVIITGHVSYPRINNSKVYLLAYLNGTAVMVFFLFSNHLFKEIPVIPKGFFGFIIWLLQLNILIVCTIPSYLKYRTIRSITLAVLTVELMVIMVIRLNPQAINWMMSLKFYSWREIYYWINPAVFLFTISMTVSFFKKEFFLGGMFSGLSFVLTTIWILGNNEHSPTMQQVVLLLTSNIFTTAGILIHWFSRMEHKVAYDPLLQVYNREYAGKIINEQSNTDCNPPFTIAMIDIDHFKNVNDTYGHQAGDQVLYAVAQEVYKGVKSDGIVCRYGGEEIIVFFPHQETKPIVKTMDQVRLNIESMITHSEKKKISVTISCGIASRGTLQNTVTQVIAAADKALYRAKKDGRNQIKVGKVTSQ